MALAGIMGLPLISCHSPIVQNPTPVEDLEFLRPAGATPYLIQPGDELEIRFFHTPDHNVTLPVRPDGHISLPLAREILVAGRSVEDVTGDLIDRYTAELREPEIAIIVHSFAAHQIHIGGEVDEPGVVQLSGSMRLVDALFQAGGLLPSARLEEVIVIRRAWSDNPLVIPVNVNDIFENTDPSQNIALYPYDAIFVPRSPIANVNIWIDQYIRQNIPFILSLRPELRN